MEIEHLIGAIGALIFWLGFGFYTWKKPNNKFKIFLDAKPGRIKYWTGFYIFLIIGLVYGIISIIFDF